MEVLKIKLYQPVACYRKPLSFGVVETFLLPPFSTVKGWIHYTADVKKEFPKKEEFPMKISIHGTFRTVGYQLQKFKKFDREREGRPKLIGFSKKYTLVSSPIYVQELFDVNLTIYLSADEELLQKFRENLLIKDFVSLGRREDLALLVEEPKPVKLEPFKAPRFLRIRELTYLTRETAKKLKLSGTYYRLGICYDDNLKKLVGWRYFLKKEDFLLAAPTSRRVREDLDFIYVDPEDGRAVEMVNLEACSGNSGEGH